MLWVVCEITIISQCDMNKTTNKPPFKVKCIDIESPYLTVGKEYDVADGIDGFYKVKNDSGRTQWYRSGRFQIDCRNTIVTYRCHF